MGRKVRERCRKGIPPSIRARAWLHLCGAKYQMENAENRQTFRRLWSSSRCEQRWLDDIEKDLHRNFPTHELFGGTYERIGQEELFRVLKAYSVLNPVEGYCQAQAPIAALLLMNMPAEDAFWCLTAICDKYIPGYRAHPLHAGVVPMHLCAHITMAFCTQGVGHVLLRGGQGSLQGCSRSHQTCSYSQDPPTLPVNVRNPGGAETPACSHCKGGVPHPTGAQA